MAPYTVDRVKSKHNLGVVEGGAQENSFVANREMSKKRETTIGFEDRDELNRDDGQTWSRHWESLSKKEGEGRALFRTGRESRSRKRRESVRELLSERRKVEQREEREREGRAEDVE